MNLSNNEKKMEIVSRLIKDGAIDFLEALELLKSDEVVMPFYPQQIQPFVQPYSQWWSVEQLIYAPPYQWEVTTN